MSLLKQLDQESSAFLALALLVASDSSLTDLVPNYLRTIDEAREFRDRCYDLHLVLTENSTAPGGHVSLTAGSQPGATDDGADQ